MIHPEMQPRPTRPGVYDGVHDRVYDGVHDNLVDLSHTLDKLNTARLTPTKS